MVFVCLAYSRSPEQTFINGVKKVCLTEESVSWLLRAKVRLVREAVDSHCIVSSSPVEKVQAVLPSFASSLGFAVPTTLSAVKLRRLKSQDK